MKVEVLGAERRRRWSLQDKLQIVEEALQPGVTVIEVAGRHIPVGGRNWTFARLDLGGHRAAALYTLIETCKLSDVDPRAWLAG